MCEAYRDGNLLFVCYFDIGSVVSCGDIVNCFVVLVFFFFKQKTAYEI